MGRPDLRLYAGYKAENIRLDQLKLRGHWIMLTEELETPGLPAGLIGVPKKNTTVGVVVLVGERVSEAIKPGDRVLFAEWQGGKWAFLAEDGTKVNVLLMDEQHIQARLGEVQ